MPGASRAAPATMRAAVQHRYGPPSVLESSEVGIASTDKVGRGAQVFSVGATKVGSGAHARWLVNYWGSQYTPPVRADPTQNFGG